MSIRAGGRPQPRSPGASPQGGAPTWKLELNSSTAKDEQYGGCRSVDCYRLLDQIGEGTYGQVYLAEDKQTGEKVALKKIRMENEKEGFPITAIREIKLLKVLNHSNVIRLKEIVRSSEHASNQMKGSIYMVFDYMDHDLTGLLERRNYKLGLPHAKCYVMQLLEGLGYCHSHGTLHRDLKAANLLINNEGELKLADFGLARPFKDFSRDSESRFTTRVITLWYRPLELMIGQTSYGAEVDMWSVGCILAELLLGKALFTGKDEVDQCKRIVNLCGYPTNANWPGVEQLPQYYMLKRDMQGKTCLRDHLVAQNLTEHAVDLLCNLLVLDPSKRLTATQAYEHDFFWHEKPDACKKSDLPKYESSHEMDMKRKRKANDNAHPSQPAHAGPHGSRPQDVKRQRYNAPYPSTGVPQSSHPWPAARPPTGRPMQGSSMAPPPRPAYPPPQPSSRYPAAHDTYLPPQQPYAQGGYADHGHGHDGYGAHGHAPGGYGGGYGPQVYPPHATQPGYGQGRHYNGPLQGGQSYMGGAPPGYGRGPYPDQQHGYSRDARSAGFPPPGHPHAQHGQGGYGQQHQRY